MRINLNEKDNEVEEFCPTLICNYRDIVKQGICVKRHGMNPDVITSNICYSLQYLEFLDNLINTRDLHNVIEKQLIKTFIIVGCSIVEAILYHCILTSDKVPRKKETQLDRWENSGIKHLPNQKVVSFLMQIEAEGPVDLDRLSFSHMAKHVERNKLLPVSVFTDLNYLRKLRNSIHLFIASKFKDKDFNAINSSQVKLVKRVLYDILTCEYFPASLEQRKALAFLNVAVPAEVKIELDHIPDSDAADVAQP